MATKNIVLKKDELVGGIADLTGESKTTVTKVIDAYPQVVTSALLANPPKINEITAVALPGFGTIALKRKPAEDRKNNFTNEIVHVEERLVPTFKVSKSIKVAVNAELFDKKKAVTKKDEKPAAKGKKSA